MGGSYEIGDEDGEYYPLELDRFDFLREENNFVKQKCDRVEADPRYTKHNIQTSDAFIQGSSGVTEILRQQPQFSETVDESLRERKIYNLYTRQTIPWSLECDQNGVSR